MLLARNSYLLRRYKEFLESNGFPYRTVAGNSVKKEHYAAISSWNRMKAGERLPAEEVRHLGTVLGMPKLSLRETQLYTKEDFYHWPWPKTWQEAFAALSYRTKMYYQWIMDRGENVLNPRFYLGTIHSVKGDEADHVVLQRDVSSSTMDNINSDHEHRVFYVGVTRARRTLNILAPQTLKAYHV